jgi:hypothetical protein
MFGNLCLVDTALQWKRIRKESRSDRKNEARQGVVTKFPHACQASHGSGCGQVLLIAAAVCVLRHQVPAREIYQGEVQTPDPTWPNSHRPNSTPNSICCWYASPARHQCSRRLTQPTGPTAATSALRTDAEELCPSKTTYRKDVGRHSCRPQRCHRRRCHPISHFGPDSRLA